MERIRKSFKLFLLISLVTAHYIDVQAVQYESIVESQRLTPESQFQRCMESYYALLMTQNSIDFGDFELSERQKKLARKAAQIELEPIQYSYTADLSLADVIKPAQEIVAAIGPVAVPAIAIGVVGCGLLWGIRYGFGNLGHDIKNALKRTWSGPDMRNAWVKQQKAFIEIQQEFIKKNNALYVTRLESDQDGNITEEVYLVAQDDPHWNYAIHIASNEIPPAKYGAISQIGQVVATSNIRPFIEGYDVPNADSDSIELIEKPIIFATNSSQATSEKKPQDKNDESVDAQAPGKPTIEDGYLPPKGWDGKKVKNPNGAGYGWPDKKGNVWVPTGPNGHGGPHWDVQYPNGDYDNVLPGGNIRGQK